MNNKDMYNEVMRALAGSLETHHYYHRLNKDEGIRTKDDIIYYIYKNEYWKWLFVDFSAEEILAVRRDRERLFLQRKENSEYRDLTGAIYMDDSGKIDYHYKETGFYTVHFTHVEKVDKAIEDSKFSKFHSINKDRVCNKEGMYMDKQIGATTRNIQAVIQYFNPDSMCKILCIGGDVDRSERLVTETMVELMKEYSLTFDEVDEIVYGTSIDNYLENEGEYNYSEGFKYKILDEPEHLVKKVVTSTDNLQTEMNKLKEENSKLKEELKVTNRLVDSFKYLVNYLNNKIKGE